jgi:hypothetical protein
MEKQERLEPLNATPEQTAKTSLVDSQYHLPVDGVDRLSVTFDFPLILNTAPEYLFRYYGLLALGGGTDQIGC